MEGKTILEKIIEESGSCCWADSSVCSECPLGKLARYDNKNFMSCVEALNIEGLTEKEADARYLAAAIDKLMDISIENVIEGNNGTQ